MERWLVASAVKTSPPGCRSRTATWLTNLSAALTRSPFSAMSMVDGHHPRRMASRRSPDCGAARLRRRVADMGVVLILLGLLGGSPDRLYETRFNFDLIDEGVGYALGGAALRAGSWALRRLLGRR